MSRRSPPDTIPTDWRRRAAKALAKGDRKGAAKALKAYVSGPLQPILAGAHAAIARRDFVLAEVALDRYLAADPDDPVALHLLGRVGLATATFASAARSLQRAVELVPTYAEARYDLALVYVLHEKFDEALAEADRLLRTAPHCRDYRRIRAGALAGRGDIMAALALNAALADAHPEQTDILLDYGNRLRPLRRGREAEAVYRRVVALAPHNGDAWWQLANLKVSALDDEDIATIRAMLASNAPSADDRYHLKFALARALEDRGDFANAMAAYRDANGERLRVRREVPMIATTDLVDRLIALFTPDFLAAHAGAGDPSSAPIFILGMPRSGSTLIEQILSMHPAIEGTQELADLDLVGLKVGMGDIGHVPPYPESLATYGSDQLRALGVDYLAGVTGKLKTTRPHFLDKQWSNWLYIGLIYLILPNARIIDTRRDPLANCVSMFRQHFARGASFTYSVDSLVDTYRAYDRLIGHFNALRPGWIKRVALGDLIDDTEATVRELLDHLGLPFATECLRFYESDRPVFTPSAEQVRRPINRDADALMKGFTPYIDDFRAALGMS